LIILIKFQLKEASSAAKRRLPLVLSLSCVTVWLAPLHYWQLSRRKRVSGMQQIWTRIARKTRNQASITTWTENRGLAPCG
jgi:hypothetical protein